MSFFRRRSDKRGKEQASKSKVVPRLNVSAASYDGGNTASSNIGEEESTRGDNLPSPYKMAGLLLVQEESHPGDLGVSAGVNAYTQKVSRLSKSLQELIRDHDAIPYLIQYMESCKAAHIIRFFLDADSFQASTWTRIRTHSLNMISKSSLVIDQKPGMKKSKSLGLDVTSPGSVVSEDSAYQESKSDAGDDGLLSSYESNSPPVTENVEYTNQGASQALQGHSAVDNNDEIKNTPTIVREESRDASNVVLDENRSIPNDGSYTTSCSVNDGKSELTVSDSDQRTREKCKADDAKSGLRLPLGEVCDTSDSRSDTESAISYRDLASPSPTTPEQGGNMVDRAGLKSASCSALSSSSREILAEKLKKSVEQDAVRIFTKYLAQEASHPIRITDDLRNNTIRKICREDGQVDPECFVECQKFALEKMDQMYYEGFKCSVYMCKYQVDILRSGKVFLTDVLYNDTALFYFMEYMEQEKLSYLLHFVIAADNFDQLLISQVTYDGMQAQEDAMVLYDKYFSLQAANPLGFPDSIRFEVEGNICREEGPLPDCFSKPRHIVLHTIEKLYFPRYLTSDVFRKYLSELDSTIQTAIDFPLGQRRRRGSESSSEHSAGGHSVGGESVSSRNTLLATGKSRPRRVQLNKLDENMRNISLDPALLNPEALWERPESGKMTLGKIDTLGQFVSSFDPDPEVGQVVEKKKSKGFFRSKREKEKEQEEMARKVAESILQDVTSVTQAISAIKNPTTPHMANGPDV